VASRAKAILDGYSKLGARTHKTTLDADTRPVRTRCAHCPASFDGTLAAGREWFAQHRLEAHPERSPSVPVSRNRAGEAASDAGPD
jgi:hypothetical protein